MKQLKDLFRKPLDEKKYQEFQSNIETLKEAFRKKLTSFEIPDEEQTVIITALTNLSQNTNKLCDMLYYPDKFITNLVKRLKLTELSKLCLDNILSTECFLYENEIDKKYRAIYSQFLEDADPVLETLFEAFESKESTVASLQEGEVSFGTDGGLLQGLADDTLFIIKFEIQEMQEKAMQNKRLTYQDSQEMEAVRRRHCEEFESVAKQKVEEWCDEKSKNAPDTEKAAINFIRSQANKYVTSYRLAVSEKLAEAAADQIEAMVAHLDAIDDRGKIVVDKRNPGTKNIAPSAEMVKPHFKKVLLAAINKQEEKNFNLF